MISTTVFSSLKNADLHCISAEEAIRDLLHFDGLVGMKRFNCWQFQMDAPSHKEAEPILTKLLTSTYYLINPNKESFYLEKLPKSPSINTNDCHLIKVSSKNEFSQKKLEEKIQKKSGVKIRDIKRSVVWLIATKKEKNISLDSMAEKIIVSKSRQKGILANTIYENFEFLNLANIIE